MTAAGKVYVYDMPAKFNAALAAQLEAYSKRGVLASWMSGMRRMAQVQRAAENGRIGASVGGRFSPRLAPMRQSRSIRLYAHRLLFCSFVRLVVCLLPRVGWLVDACSFRAASRAVCCAPSDASHLQLEQMLHAMLLHLPGRVSDPEQADVLFVPVSASRSFGLFVSASAAAAWPLRPPAPAARLRRSSVRIRGCDSSRGSASAAAPRSAARGLRR